MVKLSVNLDGVGAPREVIEAGRYTARVTEVVEGDSSSGNPMLTWSWELVGGEHEGHEMRSYTSLQEHALFGLKAHLVAMGLDADGELDFDTDKFVGKRATLVVTKEQIASKEKDGMVDINRIKAVYKLEGGSSGSAVKKPVVQGKSGAKGKVPF